MAEGGSKLIEMKKDRTPPGEVRTLGKKHQGARSQEAKFANQAHTKGKRWRSNEKKIKRELFEKITLFYCYYHTDF